METNRESFHAGGPYNPETGEYVGAGNNQPTNQPTVALRLTT